MTDDIGKLTVEIAVANPEKFGAELNRALKDVHTKSSAAADLTESKLQKAIKQAEKIRSVMNDLQKANADYYKTTNNQKSRFVEIEALLTASAARFQYYTKANKAARDEQERVNKELAKTKDRLTAQAKAITTVDQAMAAYSSNLKGMLSKHTDTVKSLNTLSTSFAEVKKNIDEAVRSGNKGEVTRLRQNIQGLATSFGALGGAMKYEGSKLHQEFGATMAEINRVINKTAKNPGMENIAKSLEGYNTEVANASKNAAGFIQAISRSAQALTKLENQQVAVNKAAAAGGGGSGAKPPLGVAAAAASAEGPKKAAAAFDDLSKSMRAFADGGASDSRMFSSRLFQMGSAAEALMGSAISAKGGVNQLRQEFQLGNVSAKDAAKGLADYLDKIKQMRASAMAASQALRDARVNNPASGQTDINKAYNTTLASLDKISNMLGSTTNAAIKLQNALEPKGKTGGSFIDPVIVENATKLVSGLRGVLHDVQTDIAAGGRQFGQYAKDLGDASDNARARMLGLTDQLVRNRMTVDESVRSSAQYRKEFSSVENAISRVVPWLEKTEVLKARMSRASNEAGRGVHSMSTRVVEATASISRLGPSINSMTGALAAIGVISFAKNIRDSAIEMDKMEATLTATFRTLEAAKVEMDSVRGVADKLGLAYEGLIRPYARLQKSIESTNLTAEDGRKIFEGIATATAAYGMSTEEARGMVKAFEQMMSKGKVQAEELRQQLGDRMPGAVNLFARAFFIARGELSESNKSITLTADQMGRFEKAMKSGQVIASEVVPIVARLLKDDLSAAAELMGTKVQAAFNRLQNAFTDFSRFVFESGLQDALLSVAASLIEVLKDESFRSFVGEIANALKVAAEFTQKWHKEIIALGIALSALAALSVVARLITFIAGSIGILEGVLIGAIAAASLFWTKIQGGPQAQTAPMQFATLGESLVFVAAANTDAAKGADQMMAAVVAQTLGVEKNNGTLRGHLSYLAMTTKAYEDNRSVIEKAADNWMQLSAVVAGVAAVPIARALLVATGAASGLAVAARATVTALSSMAALGGALMGIMGAIGVAIRGVATGLLGLFGGPVGMAISVAIGLVTLFLTHTSAVDDFIEKTNRGLDSLIASLTKAADEPAEKLKQKNEALTKTQQQLNQATNAYIATLARLKKAEDDNKGVRSFAAGVRGRLPNVGKDVENNSEIAKTNEEIEKLAALADKARTAIMLVAESLKTGLAASLANLPTDRVKEVMDALADIDAHFNKPMKEANKLIDATSKAMGLLNERTEQFGSRPFGADSGYGPELKAAVEEAVTADLGKFSDSASVKLAAESAAINQKNDAIKRLSEIYGEFPNLIAQFNAAIDSNNQKLFELNNPAIAAAGKGLESLMNQYLEAKGRFEAGQRSGRGGIERFDAEQIVRKSLGAGLATLGAGEGPDGVVNNADAVFQGLVNRVLETQRMIKDTNDLQKDSKAETKDVYETTRDELVKTILKYADLSEAAQFHQETVEKGGNKISAARLKELSALNDIHLALRNEASSRKTLESAIQSAGRSALDSDNSRILALSEARRDEIANVASLTLALEAGRKAMDGNNMSAERQQQLANNIALGNARVTESYVVQAEALEDLKIARDADIAKLDERFNSAKMENDILRAKITGSSEEVEVIARAKLQRELENITLEEGIEIRKKDLAIRKLWKEEQWEQVDTEIDALNRLQAKYAEIRSEVSQRPGLEKAAAEADKARAAMEEPFKNALRGIQSAFTNFFQELFSGGIKTFKDLASGIKAVFTTLAAELATLMVIRPAMGGFLTSIGFGSAAKDMGLTLPGSSASGGSKSPFGFNLPSSNPLDWTMANNPLSSIGQFASKLFGGPGLAITQATTATMAPATLAAMMPGEMGALAGTIGGAATPGLSGLAMTGIGAGIALAVGIALMAFLNKKPTVGPNANATIGYNGNRAVIVDSGADNGGDKGKATELVTASIKAYNTIVSKLGATSSTGALTGFQMGYFKNKFFVDDTRRGGSARYDENQFDTAEAAIADFLKRALTGAGVTGLSEIMRTVLKNTKATNVDELTKDLDFAKLYERNFEAADPLRESLENLTIQFDEFRRQAEDLGLEVSKVNEGFQKQINLMKDTFSKTIAESINSIVSPALGAFIKMEKENEQRVKDARTLGLSLIAVERLNYLQRRSFILSLAAEEREMYMSLLGVVDQIMVRIASMMDEVSTSSSKAQTALAAAAEALKSTSNTYRSLAQSMRKTASDLRISDLSTLSPTDKLQEALNQYNAAKTAAAGGDQTAATNLQDLARRVLEIGQANYSSGPQYQTLFQMVQDDLISSANGQDAIALRLDIQATILNAQLEVLQSINEALSANAQAQDSVSALSALTYGRNLTDYESLAFNAVIDQLMDDFENNPLVSGKLGGIKGRLSDKIISASEAGANAADVDAIRVALFGDLQSQIGEGSDLLLAFTGLNTVITYMATNATTLGGALSLLGDVLGGIGNAVGGDDSPIQNLEPLANLLDNLHDVLVDALEGVEIGEEFGSFLTSLSEFSGDLLDLANTIGSDNPLTGSNLEAIGYILSGIGLVIDSVSGVAIDPARLQNSVVHLTNLTTIFSTSLPEGLTSGIGTITSILGALPTQLDTGIVTPIVNLNTTLSSLNVAIKMNDLVLAIDDLNDVLSGGNNTLGGLMRDAADATLDFKDNLTTLIEYLKEQLTNTGPINGTVPTIDSSPFTGGSGVNNFIQLADRAAAYVGARQAKGMGVDDATLGGTTDWQWAISKRDEIIGQLSTEQDVMSLLTRYYGGQTSVNATASDQGANNLIRRLEVIRQGSGPPTTNTGMGAALRRWAEDNPMYGPEGWSEPRRIDSLDTYGALNALNVQGISPSWYSAYLKWWNEGHKVSEIDRYARGGIIGRDTMYAYENHIANVAEQGRPEAAMPLVRGPGGRLGVSGFGGGGDGGEAAKEVKELRRQVAELTHTVSSMLEVLVGIRTDNVEHSNDAEQSLSAIVRNLRSRAPAVPAGSKNQ